LTTRKKALITGITGQDGSYLAEFLLYKEYEVHGLIRNSSTFNTERINHLCQDSRLFGVRFFLHYGDLSDAGQLTNIICKIRPDEIYNLGAQSHVRVSFDSPEYTGDITGLGTTRILEAIRRNEISTKFYQASSSEMFGDAPAPQNEESPFRPRSPYAASKVYAYWMVRNYREGYKLFACNGILFNHESPRRGETFLTRKITRGIANIIAKKEKKIYLGNLEAKRDWGYAPEYVEAMWLMLQQEKPDDYVIGAGKTYSVKEFLEEAFRYINLDWQKYIEIDPRYYRPTEVKNLRADPTKAKKLLNWSSKISFNELAKIMIDYDLELICATSPGEGKRIIKQKGLEWNRCG